MKRNGLRWLAIVLMIETGLLHFFTAQGEYEEAAYMGYLFMANFLGALVAAYGIYRKQLWGWAFGSIIAAGSIAGYIWSRTAGMPGMQVEEWLTPFGLVAIAVEGLFLLLVLMRPWKSVATGDEHPSTPTWFRYLSPASAVLVMALISFSAFQWDAATGRAEEHSLIKSVAELRSTPPTAFDDLEQQYGVQVSRVAITAMDSIVDVRLKVVDPDKAHRLLDSHAALLVNQQSLILAPHMHSHYKLKPGQVYVMFFPTQRNTVETGSQVSLVYGSVRVEPVTVQ